MADDGNGERESGVKAADWERERRRKGLFDLSWLCTHIANDIKKEMNGGKKTHSQTAGWVARFESKDVYRYYLQARRGMTAIGKYSSQPKTQKLNFDLGYTSSYLVGWFTSTGISYSYI